MQPRHLNAPTPDLRIVETSSLYAHEEHDSQRSGPLVARLQQDGCVKNPPIVAEIPSGKFVILDGANRCYALAELGYQHSLVQVVNYDSGYVELSTWRHIIAGWDSAALSQRLEALSGVKIHDTPAPDALATFVMRDQHILSLHTPAETIHERNAILRQIVGVYQQNAALYRTAISEPETVWPLYETAVALVIFPAYQPTDIIAAAQNHAFLPPGISRHIIHGRALRVNYALSILRDDSKPLAAKNEDLHRWLQDKLAKRQVRYYAEATYQFDE